MLDIAFPELRFVVEVDGWAHHVDREAFENDRARKRALVADGWTVVEVTWHDLEQRPSEVVDQIRRVLARLGHPGAA